MAIDVGLIEVIVSPNRMRVRGRFNPDGNPESYDEVKLLSGLAAQNIEVTDEVRDRVRLLSERLATGEVPGEDVLLAEGIAPVDGEDGYVEWAPDCDPTQSNRPPPEGDDGVVDYYARSSIVSISQGDLVCTVIPPTEGTPGRDVYGRDVHQHKGHRAPVVFAESIVRDGEEGRMVAATSGRLNFIAERAWISPLLVVNRDVDFQVGNINFDGDVLIRGNVLDLFQVKCTRSVVVKGLVEAATIECQGDLTVAGGIAGKEKAVIKVGGKITARFIDNATVTATGDVFVQKELVNSQISTEGQVITPGAITACRVEASGSIRAALVGSKSGIPTSLTAGQMSEILRQLGRLERELAAIEDRIAQSRARLEPMLQRHNALPQIQKNMVVKLLTSVKEDMGRAEQLKKKKEELQEAIRANRGVCIQVSRLVHEGTTVQIGKATATLRDSLRGPLKLVSHTVDGAARIAAGSDEGGLVVLESYK